jgi:hypothetical protein
MEQKGFRRKLTAILSADVSGYSRLMQDNEAATLAMSLLPILIARACRRSWLNRTAEPIERRPL